MTIDFTSAAKAYASANRMIGGAAADAKGGETFGKLLQNAAAGVVDALGKSEQQSLQAVTGKADLAAVTEAVTNAQMALQTVVAVRDKVIAAYQDILKMPI
ncbi:MAG: flagellar hook-basal body complex protein FliE [Stellaceae bacterium]